MRFTTILVITSTLTIIPFYGHTDEATDAFNLGKELFKKEDYAAASEAFRDANQLRPNWRLLYNIGQSEAAAKRYGLALEAFEAYMAKGGDDIPMTRRDEVLIEIERMRLLVGELEITAPEGAKVIIDDVFRGNTPLSGALLVAAGVEHQVILMKNNDYLFNQKVKVNGGATRAVNVEDTGEATAEETPDEIVENVIDTPDTDTLDDKSTEETAYPIQKSHPLILPGWVTTGVGAAVLVGGAVTGAMALSLNKDLDQTCKNGCPPSEVDKEERLDTLVLSTNILLSVGAAATITGVILLVIGKRKSKAVSWMPVLNPVLVGSTISWRF